MKCQKMRDAYKKDLENKRTLKENIIIFEKYCP